MRRAPATSARWLLQTAQADKEQTLRTLMSLALDDKDWDGAKKLHRDLLKLEPTSLFVRGELGRELFSRGEYVRAEVELQDVVAAAAGDNRALAPALKELGRTQAKAHENAAALATLKKALAASGPETALRAEIYEIVTEIYRADQQLPVLIKQLEDEHPTDFARLALLGALYEETGDGAKAIEAFKRALAINPRQIDLRLRMVRLLQESGDLDQAIAEYEALIRAAPNNPQFVFEECSALLERGDRARALRLIGDLEARAGSDDEVLSRVADFYARIGEKDRSLKVLERLAQLGGGGDAGHLVDLGDRYFQDGNAPLAVQTWKRILTTVQPRAKAFAALGDVYLEHDMTTDALGAYKEAVALEPTNLGYEKALAAAYERTRAYHEAEVLYEEIAAHAKDKGDRALARECRTRIVTLWGLQHTLEPELPGLRRQFGATPPDPEAGRTLAEALTHLRRLPEAEAALRRVLELAPGDAESYLALERVLVQESKIAEAIAVLERLAQAEPKRARELYQRMAQYALQIYDDDDAIRYAARAVELNPDDAEGHRRLGEMYRSRQDVDHAIAEFRAAIAKNDRLFVVYFELADLLLSKGLTEEADRLFRVIVRAAPDEELVARAARLSMQINLGKGTLDSLEQDLLPLAIGNPQRPIYRHLLVEIYGSMTFGLVQRVTHGTAKEADDARQALARVGSRAVKPLLDALADPDVSQQRIAVDVLAYVQNRNAALPLFAFATGSAEPALRVRAMIACGALADGTLVPKYEALLFPKDTLGDPTGAADAVGVAAVWGLAQMGDPRGLPVLRRVARTGTAPMRALAVLGLGRAHDGASAAEIAEIARAVDAGALTRAAAAYALGELNAQAFAPALIEIAEDGEMLPRRMALVALARMASSAGAREPGWKHEAVQAMADAVFVGDSDAAVGRGPSGALPETAVAALSILAAGRDGGRRAGGADAAPSGAFDVAPTGALDVDALLDGLAPQRSLGGGARGGAGAVRRAGPAGGARGAPRVGDASHRRRRRARHRPGRALAVRAAGGDGAGGRRGARDRDRARAGRRASGAKPGSCDPDEGDRARGSVGGRRGDRRRRGRPRGHERGRPAGRHLGGGRAAPRRPERSRRRAGRRVAGEDPRDARELGAAYPRGAGARAAGRGPRPGRRPPPDRGRGRGPVRPRPPGSARGPGLVRSRGRPGRRGARGRHRSRTARPRGGERPGPVDSAHATRGSWHRHRSSAWPHLPGCRDLSGFSTTDGDRYDNPVVNAGFVLAGIQPGTTLCLTIDTDHLQDAPGAISTDDGMFHKVPLRPIPQIWHDPLSTLSFGEGRLKNLIYVATSTAGDDVFVVVSLMQDGDIEVRLLRGAPSLPATTAAATSGGNLFAVFDLTRKTGPCSY